MPGSGTPPDCGNQDWTEAYCKSESRMPMPKAAAAATPKELKLAISTAASAGTTWSGSVSGSSSVTEEAKIPSPPAMNAAISALMREIVAGDRPPSIAPVSFSAAAQVARPNRVHL